LREENGVRSVRVWARLLGVEKGVVVEGVDYDEDADALVVSVRPRRGSKGLCGRCGLEAPGFDQGRGRRRWRALDLGEVKAYLEADAPRVTCPVHGVVVARVPWARHDTGHTYAFDDTAAWLATHCSKSAVGQLLRVAWRTVGEIITRVVADARAAHDPFDGLRRIGIDEISYKRGHRYLTVVVDHDSGRLVWAAPGRDKATLRRFFDELGETRCAAVRLVSSDEAHWIDKVVKERCPNATRCADPFHVVAWASNALDEVRREVAKATRGPGGKGHAQTLHRARYALWKNPENLTERQQRTLEELLDTHHPLFVAYLLKEQLRLVFRTRGYAGVDLLDQWVDWARESGVPQFRDLAVTITWHRDSIDAALIHGLSNGRVEAVNTKLRLLTRIAFGFRSPDALIALAMLDLGGYCPPLPGRQAA